MHARERYLSRHASPEVADLARDLPTIGLAPRAHVLCIPAFDETPDFLDRLPGANDLTVVVVVNAPESAAPRSLARTLSLLETLTGSSTRHPFTVVDTDQGAQLLVVDRVSPGRRIPVKQGVGCARRIANDCALLLIGNGLVQVRRLFNTDADVRLPAGYFDADGDPDAAAWVYPFRHVPAQAGLTTATRLYDAHLRYYVDRLAWAGSPYAFHTLGSTIAVEPDAYAAVRGVPRRNAAEDFYLLNKLAKVGAVCSLAEPELEITARISARVPFGTGPALARIMGDPDAQTGYPSYAPAAFEALRHFLTRADELMAGSQRVRDGFVHEIVQRLGFYEFRATALSQYRDAGHRMRAFHEWFDAFRTMKFVHAASDYWPPEPLLRSIASLDRGSEAPGNRAGVPAPQADRWSVP